MQEKMQVNIPDKAPYVVPKNDLNKKLISKRHPDVKFTNPESEGSNPSGIQNRIDELVDGNTKNELKTMADSLGATYDSNDSKENIATKILAVSTTD